MKLLNYQEVIEDIDKRLKLFDKSRIVKNTIDFDKISSDTFIEKIVEKNIINKNIVLSIVTDDFVAKDLFENEKSQIDELKLANFRKNDNFFLGEEIPVEVPVKKETTNFFKSISGFFNDNKKDSKTKEIPQKEIKPEINIEKVVEIVATPLELENEPVDIAIPQEDTDAEKAVKAEKLRLIEEEYRLKAEKREAEEKLLNDKITSEEKKSTADFRKNKRKK